NLQFGQRLPDSGALRLRETIEIGDEFGTGLAALTLLGQQPGSKDAQIGLISSGIRPGSFLEGGQGFGHPPLAGQTGGISGPGLGAFSEPILNGLGQQGDSLIGPPAGGQEVDSGKGDPWLSRRGGL